MAGRCIERRRARAQYLTVDQSVLQFHPRRILTKGREIGRVALAMHFATFSQLVGNRVSD